MPGRSQSGTPIRDSARDGASVVTFVESGSFRLSMEITKRRHEAAPLDLEDVERRLRPLTRRYLGVGAIPLDRVVGTDSRVGAFTRRFERGHRFTPERLRALEAAPPNGGFPPIVAVNLGETHFVIDGRHRVALARRHGGATIDADITEVVAKSRSRRARTWSRSSVARSSASSSR